MSKLLKNTSRDGSTFTCEVFEEYGQPFGEGKWQFRLTKTSWNGNETKFDLRKWSPDGEKFGQGITLTDSELYDLLCAIEEALG